MSRRITIIDWNGQFLIDGIDEFSTNEMRLLAAAINKMAHVNCMHVSNMLNLQLADEHLFKGVKNNHYVK